MCEFVKQMIQNCVGLLISKRASDCKVPVGNSLTFSHNKTDNMCE